MNKSIKISRLFTFFVAAVMCITCLCSCGNVFNPDRIVEIYFVSFTGVNTRLKRYPILYLQKVNIHTSSAYVMSRMAR